MKTLYDAIRTVPNYPKDGIMFRDITTLLSDARAFMTSVDALVQHHVSDEFDLVAGIEARGFIVGGALAHRLACGFIPVRKKGKLPAATFAQDYDLEYGTDTLEIHSDALTPGQKVLLVDDLIATGGTAEAAIKLIERAGGEVIACSFVIDLPDLGGRAKLEAMGKPVLTLVSYEGD